MGRGVDWRTDTAGFHGVDEGERERERERQAAWMGR